MLQDYKVLSSIGFASMCLLLSSHPFCSVRLLRCAAWQDVKKNIYIEEKSKDVEVKERGDGGEDDAREEGKKK